MKIILFGKPEFSSTTRASFFIKNTKNNHSRESDWWEYTKYCFKENAKILSKKSTSQDLDLKRMLELFLAVPPLKENIKISRKNLLFFLKKTKKLSSASAWWGNSKSSFKGKVFVLIFTRGHPTYWRKKCWLMSLNLKIDLGYLLG